MFVGNMIPKIGDVFLYGYDNHLYKLIEIKIKNILDIRKPKVYVFERENKELIFDAEQIDFDIKSLDGSSLKNKFFSTTEGIVPESTVKDGDNIRHSSGEFVYKKPDSVEEYERDKRFFHSGWWQKTN